MASTDGYTTEILVKAFSISMFILKLVVATPCPIERIIDHYRNLSHLNEIPPFHYRGSPTEVRISIFVQSVSAVNEVDMDYTIDIYLRQRWEDPRLAFDLCDNDIYLNSNWLKKIWLPDIFFVNSKSEVFHDVTVPNIALRISPNGAIFFSQRLSINLGCVMELFKFPLDVQNCETQLLSYSYRIEELVVKWMDESEPVQLDPGIRLPQTDIHATEHGACLLAYDGRNYSCIFTRFKLQRLNGFYVIQIYVPGILIVMLSWVSFWLDPRATPARVSLGLLCVLTTTTHTTGINSSLPRVSYVKAMDVWNFTCLLFVFGALLEFAVINVKTRKEESHGRNLHIHKTSRSISKPSPWIISCLPSAPEVTSAMPRVTRVCHWTAEKVDKTCRVLFPLAFLIFNIIYWTYYKLSPTYSNASAFSGQQQDLL